MKDLAHLDTWVSVGILATASGAQKAILALTLAAEQRVVVVGVTQDARPTAPALRRYLCHGIRLSTPTR